MKLPFIKVGVVTCLAAGLLAGQAVAAPVQGPVYAAAGEEVATDNPSFQIINELLTKAAIEKNIPPEVVKAVAMQESGWQHFKDGAPYQSDDNGYGIMQITNFANYEGEEDSIKNNIEANIAAGVEILDDIYNNRKDLPTVKNADRFDIESWYFPVMAYNGIKPVNSPLKQADGKRNVDAYQEQVFAKIEEANDLELGQFQFDVTDFKYDPDSDKNIEFLKDEYEVANPHKSVYFFKNQEQVVTRVDTRLRETPRTGDNKIIDLPKNTTLVIAGGFQYDENLDSKNQFVWYPVRTADNQYGFVSSAYLKKAEAGPVLPKPIPETKFSDVNSRYQPAVDYLLTKGITGKSETIFGTDEPIKRVDAAIMLAKAAGWDIESASASGFTDVPARAVKHVNAMKAMEITSGKSATSFGAQDLITRGELAVWIEKAFKLQADPNLAPLLFDDVAPKYGPSVAALVSNEVTSGTSATTFGTYDNAKRGDYALFLYRAAH